MNYCEQIFFIHLRLAINADLTITVEKLLEMTEIMGDEDIGDWLDLPKSKVDEIKTNYDSPFRRREAYLDLYATQHPCPSWKRVARSLRRFDLFRQANEVESTYVQGACINMHTVVSRVSAREHLNIARDFGPHGRLPGIKIPYACIEAVTVAP